MTEGLVKYPSGLVHLIYKQSGELASGDSEILSMECIVAGTTFIKNLSKIEKYLEEGQLLDLKREPKNKYDKFAIVICNSSGEKLGYIPREKNEMMARLMDAGKSFYGKVQKKSWEGSWLKIDIEIYLKD
jgi:hypothetical protein